MKLSTQQLYINLCIDKEKKESFGFFRRKKPVIKSKYCPKCCLELSNGKCLNDRGCT